MTEENKKPEEPEMIAEISAKDMIVDGYFSMIRRGMVIAGMGADIPVAVSPAIAKALDDKGQTCGLFTMMMLKTMREYLITAIKTKADIEPIKMVMPFLIKDGPVMMVLQPFASDDQRPVLTVYLPEED